MAEWLKKLRENWVKKRNEPGFNNGKNRKDGSQREKGTYL